jgi:hypothetical protein
MEIAGKIETDDIYSYLNQYQEQYVKELLIADGQAQSGTKASIKVQDNIK